MLKVRQQTDPKGAEVDNLFIVVCASGFENPARVRSALMFASLAAAANCRSILYCIQEAVDVMAKGSVEKHEKEAQGMPTIGQRLYEAIDMGVEIQCCTQTMANKNIAPEGLIPEATPAGAMSLIDLASQARGTLCF
ncbi:MAG: DsrE family protein [Thermoleophilia bacterium]|nr:DsrE family protein [Thermoleophilia bacterium]